MTPQQKTQIVLTSAQGTGNLARLLHYPDDAFKRELDHLIHTLTIQRNQLLHPTILDTSEDDDL